MNRAGGAAMLTCGLEQVRQLPVASLTVIPALRVATLTFNVLTALKRLALPPELLSARPQRLAFP